MKKTVMALLTAGLVCMTLASTSFAQLRDQTTITIKLQQNGSTQTFTRVVPGSDIQAVVLGTRPLLMDVFTTVPPPPAEYIFHCGGDFEQSDGTCEDVIVACAILDVEFKCNTYDREGVCTNGGC